MEGKSFQAVIFIIITGFIIGDLGLLRPCTQGRSLFVQTANAKEEIQESRQDIIDLSLQKNIIQKQLVDLEKENTALKQANANLKSGIAKLKSANLQLETKAKEVYTKAQKSKQKEKKLKDLSRASERLTQEQRALEKENTALKQANANLKSGIAKLKSANLQLETKAKEVYTKVQKSKQKEKELKDLSRAVECLHHERLALTKENEQLKQKVIVLSDTLQNERATLYQKLGIAYTELKLFASAIENYEKSLSFNSDNAQVHYNLGLLYQHSQNNSKKAVSHFKKYIRLSPESFKEKKEVEYLIKMLTRRD